MKTTIAPTSTTATACSNCPPKGDDHVHVAVAVNDDDRYDHVADNEHSNLGPTWDRNEPLERTPADRSRHERSTTHANVPAGTSSGAFGSPPESNELSNPGPTWDHNELERTPAGRSQHVRSATHANVPAGTSSGASGLLPESSYSVRAHIERSKLASTWPAVIGATIRNAHVCAWTIAVACIVAFVSPASAERGYNGGDDDEDDDAIGMVDLAPDVVAAASATLRNAPPIGEVLEAAYAAAGLDRDPTKSWIRRARVAGLIPWLTVRAGWDQSWHDDEPADIGRSRTFEVRATWRLDRLLFDGRELQMSSIDTSRRRERRRLASHVIRAYFAWRRVTAAATRDPKFSLAAEAATAELDALTDAWFSDRTKSTR